MAKELLCDVKKELQATLLSGKHGRLKNKRGGENAELKELSFKFPTLLAKIQEAEAKIIMMMERGTTSAAAAMQKNFVELKEFVYEVEDDLDKLRIEALISQERCKDLITRVSSSISLRRHQGLHQQHSPPTRPKPDEQQQKQLGNTHLMAPLYNRLRKFFLFTCQGKFRLNFTDLEQRLNTNFCWIDGLMTENEINIVNLPESSDEDDRRRRLTPESSYYSSLPKHLKLCFKYFSLIPKGYWIEKEVLTQLWMAEGFTINPEEEEEETAEEMFDKFLLNLKESTTFLFKDIEKEEDGNIVRCKIHEEWHDFICDHISAEGGDFSVITDGRKPDFSLHSSLHCCLDDDDIKSLVDSCKAKKMRTLLCFGSQSSSILLKVPTDLFSHLKLLRVLDLSFSFIEEFPHCVAKLEHLRYLNLSYTHIKKLPAFIRKLYLLQTLKLSHSLLNELPRETWKLQKLRHLEIDGTPMNHLPSGIGRLNNIHKLSEFIVGGDGGCSIEELANLEHLQGRLIISHLDRVSDQGDSGRAKLNTKHRIKHLILDGKKHLSSQNLLHKRHFNSLLLEHMCNEAEFKLDDDGKMESAEKVFEGINPHSGLKRLEIWNYFGSKLPTWLAKSLSGLVSLKLAKCLKMDHMPHLGELPSLKFLHICDMVEVKHIESCDLKGFPKLEKLTLEGMPIWEEWKLELQQGEDLPCFLELILSNCPRLKNLPALPQTLRKLEIHDCKEIQWNDLFPPLPTLEYLVLKGKVGNLCSIPKAPKLVSFTVALSPEMTSFPHGFDQLESLSALNIHFCPRLGSLPEELKHLNNLKRLHIAGCRLLTEDWLKKNKEVLKNITNVEIAFPSESGNGKEDDADNSDGDDEDD